MFWARGEGDSIASRTAFPGRCSLTHTHTEESKGEQRRSKEIKGEQVRSKESTRIYFWRMKPDSSFFP